MKNTNIQPRALTQVTARFGLLALFSVLLFVGCGQSNSPTANLTLHPAAKKSPSSVLSLGSAESFAVLGGPAVTLTNSTVNGDVGSGFPGSAVTITGSTITGTVHEGDAVAIAAYTDFLGAYNELGAVLCGQTLTGTLAGVTLSPGVYCFDAAATLTGTLTLKGDANAIWIFKIGTLGTGALTGTNFNVVMDGGGNPCNVYWWVAEAATMTTSNFLGTILAGMAITVTGGTFSGNAYAKAAVTLTGATISSCGTISPPFKPKANEGVGNGVDGNTPGHDHNGGNDDPAYSPGNPGAKNK